MLETPHVAVGAAIAAKIPNPFVAIPLAFISHFVLDKVPHWNPHLNTETKEFGYPTKKSTILVIIDCSLALLTGSLIAYSVWPDKHHALTIFLASFFSILPDLIEAPYFYLKNRSKFLEDWIAFQKSIQVDTTPFLGLLTQIITLVAVIIWLKN